MKTPITLFYCQTLPTKAISHKNGGKEMLYLMNARHKNKSIMTSVGKLRFDARGIAACENVEFGMRLAKAKGYSIADEAGHTISVGVNDPLAKNVVNDAEGNEENAVTDNSGMPLNDDSVQENPTENGNETIKEEEPKNEGEPAEANEAEGNNETKADEAGKVEDGNKTEATEDNKPNAEARKAEYEEAVKFLNNTTNSNAKVREWAQNHDHKVKATNRVGMTAEILQALFPEFV